jgi:hypothetical protein
LVAKLNIMWDISPMITVKADDRRRVQIPGIRAGQVFALEDHGGTVTLIPLKKEEPRTIMLKLVKRGGVLVAVLPDGSKVDPEGIAQAVREEREAQAERGNR